MGSYVSEAYMLVDVKGLGRLNLLINVVNVSLNVSLSENHQMLKY